MMAPGRDATAARQQNDLGNGFARQGRFDEAETYYLSAIRFDPDCAEAHNNLGSVFRELGKSGDAAACYERAIAIEPNFAMAHNNLGIALKELGRFAEAEASHRRALALAPHYAEAHFNLGNALFEQKQYDAAIDCFRRAIVLQPNYADASMNLGIALQCEDKFDEAGECYRRATTLRPNYAEAHRNLGNIFMVQDRADDAAPCFERALALKPDYAEAHLGLGNVWARKGQQENALDSYRRAIALKPDYAEAHANAALVHLRLGNFDEGWHENEWRWRLHDMKGANAPAIPLWDGGDLHGRTILLYGEQGLGDSIQFIRYAPMVKAKGGHVLLSCPQPLLRLFEGVAGIDGIFQEGSDIPACDCRAPLLSLPFLFETRLDTIPHAIPYLSAPPHRAAAWADRLQSYAGLKVGLVWAGNSRENHILAHEVDRRRSLRLDQCAPLARVLGTIHFFSLQKGAPADQAKKPPPGLTLIDLMDSIEDFADTAALIANLDLVIGVDTSVIHLAGAMGKSVWVLSRFDGCWRWLLKRDDSPWYPSLRLFRQTQSGDWTSVIERLCAALEKFVPR